MKKFFFVCLVVLLPFGASAADDVTDLVVQMQKLLEDYKTRVTALEIENKALRIEMAKAGIQIPLSVLQPSLDASPIGSGTSSTSGTATSSTPQTPVSTGNDDVDKFITQIHKDWKGIQGAYGLPEDSQLGGYEFVLSGDNDYVFADIIFSTSGEHSVYDVKILYQFERTDYKRKLIGYFVYDAQSGKYITTKGTNPFAGVSRNFVKDPYFKGYASVPSTAGTTQDSNTSGGTSTSTASSSITEISKAYEEKRYLTAISLATAFLQTNSKNTEVLSILYKTYFIIGKNDESLNALVSLEKAQGGTLDRQSACNGQVIATYAKNTALIEKYAKICAQ